MNWNKLKNKHFKWACENGQHDTEYPQDHWLMLVITEISEAVQADRIGKVANRDLFNFNKRRRLLPFQENFEIHIKDSVEDEFADIILRILDYCGLYDIDLSTIMEEGDIFSYLHKKLELEYLADYEYSVTVFGYTLCSYIMYNHLLSKKLSESYIKEGLLFCIEACKRMDIDIMWHIEQKMKYNETRPRLNGKLY